MKSEMDTGDYLFIGTAILGIFLVLPMVSNMLGLNVGLSLPKIPMWLGGIIVDKQRLM